MRGVHQDPFPHIPEKVRQEGASTRPVQYLRCSHKGCKKQVEITIKGTRKPPDVICKMAKNKGWLPDMKKGAHLCPDHANPEKTVTTKTDTPTISPDMRRKIFRAIDEAYDEKAQRYVDGFDDKMVAAQVGTTWGWVSRIRDENFGPAGPDPRITGMLDEIAELATQTAAAEVAALEAAEKAENLSKALVQLKARVEAWK